MARKTIYECDVCGISEQKPTTRIAIQLYTTANGYPQYKTEDKWDVCKNCGQKINDFILGLRNEHREESNNEDKK